MLDMLQKIGKQRVYSELIGICEERGKRQGWADHTYREIFGRWPRGVFKEAATAGPEVLAYVRYKNIRYAMSRGKRQEVDHAV